MEGVENPTEVVGKGKGKAPQAMEESAEEDSSDESGAEDQVRLNPKGRLQAQTD